MENTNVGPFKILRKLGSRRQKVYHAIQVEQNRDVALKFINVPRDVDWLKAADKINREVAVLKQLTHPNLVQVYGAGCDDEKIFFAHELVECESLSAILARRGKLAPDHAMDFGYQIALFLEYIHENQIIHSKLSPEKILITPESDVKVSDLRLNRPKKRRWDATTRRELDLAAYMAPEQFSKGSTEKSDFYALGVIMYEMLTGRLPYEPDTLGRMAKKKMTTPITSVANDVFNCPVWLDKIVTQMLQPNPKDRPHSARAIIFAFDEIKKIDTEHKSAIAHVTGRYNPLTAGEDRSEAERILLGRRRKNANKFPFYQSIWFLLLSLIVIAGVIATALLPPSNQRLYEQATELMLSDQKDNWVSARVFLKTLLDREDLDEVLRAKAEVKFYESKRRTLVHQAENGTFLIAQGPFARKFGEAVALGNEGKIEEAKNVFRKLVDEVDPAGDERHIHAESQSRIESLIAGQRVKLPTDPEGLTNLITPTVNAKSPAELRLAKSLLERIIFRFSDKQDLKETIALARSNLDMIEQKILGVWVPPVQADSVDPPSSDNSEKSSDESSNK